MNTKAKYTRRNLAYRDGDYSPANGVSLWETCPQLAALDPATAFTFFDDFFRIDITGGDSGWISTETEGGAGDAAIAVSDAAGGVLTILNDAADNDSVELQWGSEHFKLATAKPLWFEIRLKVSDATQSDFAVGLAKINTTVIDTPADAILMKKDDGDANIDFLTDKDGTPTATDTTSDAVDDTWVKLGFFFDGAGTAYGYVDGVLKATHTTNICDDEELAVTIAWQNGEAVAKTMSVDYVKVVQVR